VRLISALANVPINQSIAITGSVDQFGRVQPVGGLNEKIEGFFTICQQRGLTGKQGVIIPAANVRPEPGRNCGRPLPTSSFYLGMEDVTEALPILTQLLGRRRTNVTANHSGADCAGDTARESSSFSVAATLVRWFRFELIGLVQRTRVSYPASRTQNKAY
jgi:hypothetical protein